MSRAVIIVPGLAVPQQNAITTYFKDNNQTYGFWHWGSDTWLVSSETDPLDTAALRNKIMSLAPGSKMIVLKVEPSEEVPNWAAFGPGAWLNWLREAWEKKRTGS